MQLTAQEATDSSTLSPSNAQSIRVRRLRVPMRRNNVLQLILFSVGVPLSWFMMFLVLILVSLLLVGDSNSTLPSWAQLSFPVLALVGPVLWVWGYIIFRQRRLLRRSKLRSLRLACIARHRDASIRLPHRLVEYLFRSAYFNRIRLGRLLRTILLRQAFVIEDAAGDYWRLPGPCDITFEPLDISNDTEDVAHLIQESIRQQYEINLDEDENDGSGSKETRRSRYHGGPKYGALFTYVTFSAVGFLIVAFQVFKSPDPWSIGAIAILLLSLLLWRASFERRWWLVPGGLIYREVRAWRKVMKIRMLTPDDTTLVVDFRTRRTTVLDQGRRSSFSCGEWAQWLVVAGWISRARRPTEEEVRSFLESGTK